MPDKFTDVKKAKEYLKKVKVNAFRTLDTMDDKTILILANANWRMLGDTEIKEVEFPND